MLCLRRLRLAVARFFWFHLDPLFFWKVPDPDEGMPEGERRYQIYLKSPAGPIDVYVVSQASIHDACVLVKSSLWDLKNDSQAYFPVFFLRKIGVGRCETGCKLNPVGVESDNTI